MDGGGAGREQRRMGRFGVVRDGGGGGNGAVECGRAGIKGKGKRKRGGGGGGGYGVCGAVILLVGVFRRTIHNFN